tara:strand:+ start:649 stop:792 length:144 start_codon:yes stop_codon:yes gene_type:complete
MMCVPRCLYVQTLSLQGNFQIKMNYLNKLAVAITISMNANKKEVRYG